MIILNSKLKERILLARMDWEEVRFTPWEQKEADRCRKVIVALVDELQVRTGAKRIMNESPRPIYFPPDNEPSKFALEAANEIHNFPPDAVIDDEWSVYAAMSRKETARAVDRAIGRAMHPILWVAGCLLALVVVESVLLIALSFS